MSKHVCHAVGCEVGVRPEFLMCRLHWFMVPSDIRRKVLSNYRAGQCDDKQPSRPWLLAAREAVNAVHSLEHKVQIIYSCVL